jgi:hypothetical protein
MDKAAIGRPGALLIPGGIAYIHRGAQAVALADKADIVSLCKTAGAFTFHILYILSEAGGLEEALDITVLTVTDDEKQIFFTQLFKHFLHTGVHIAAVLRDIVYLLFHTPAADFIGPVPVAGKQLIRYACGGKAHYASGIFRAYNMPGGTDFLKGLGPAFRHDPAGIPQCAVQIENYSVNAHSSSKGFLEYDKRH